MRPVLLALIVSGCMPATPAGNQVALHSCAPPAPAPADLPRITTVDRLRDSRNDERDARQANAKRLRECGAHLERMNAWARSLEN